MRALSLVAVVILAGCGPSGPSLAERARAEKIAADACDSLMNALLQRLTAALKESKPAEALTICGRVAQQLTADIAAANQVAMRRVALRVRNPKNAPDSWERGWLQQEEKRYGADKSGPVHAHSEIVTVAGGHELRYLRPIVFKSFCSQCHGGEQEIAAETRESLVKAYPEDRATGYRPGDLRGAVSVRVRLP